MSANIYTTQGICNYQLDNYQRKKGEIHYYCHFSGTLKCPNCGSTHVVKKTVLHRSFLGCPTGVTTVHLEMDIPKVFCKECGKTRKIRTPFAPTY